MTTFHKNEHAQKCPPKRLLDWSCQGEVEVEPPWLITCNVFDKPLRRPVFLYGALNPSTACTVRSTVKKPHLK